MSRQAALTCPHTGHLRVRRGLFLRVTEELDQQKTQMLQGLRHSDSLRGTGVHVEVGIDVWDMDKFLKQ